MFLEDNIYSPGQNCLPITGQTTEQEIDGIRSASGLDGDLWLVTDTNRLQKFDIERVEPILAMNLYFDIK